MYGFKGTDANFKCLNQTYCLNEKFIYEGDIAMCSQGFHFCKKLKDVNNYYKFDYTNNRYFIIKYGDNNYTTDDKSITNEITFIAEINLNNIKDIIIEYKELIIENFDGIFMLICTNCSDINEIKSFLEYFAEYKERIIKNFDKLFIIICKKCSDINEIKSLLEYIEKYVEDNDDKLSFIKMISLNKNTIHNWLSSNDKKDIIELLNIKYKEYFEKNLLSNNQYFELMEGTKLSMLKYLNILLNDNN
jgi:hypothetical protein